MPFAHLRAFGDGNFFAVHIGDFEPTKTRFGGNTSDKLVRFHPFKPTKEDRKANKERISKILTPEQNEKWEKIQAERREKMQERKAERKEELIERKKEKVEKSEDK